MRPANSSSENLTESWYVPPNRQLGKGRRLLAFEWEAVLTFQRCSQPARATARPLGALMNRNANLASVRYL
jgi:hypothetical protein